MIEKLLPVLLGAFMSGVSGSAAAAPGLSRALVRRWARAAAVGALGLVIFGAGLMAVILDLALTSNRIGSLALSAVSAVGAALMIVPAVLGWWVSGRSAAVEPVEMATARAPEERVSPLNEALAHLVLDFVEERRAERERSQDRGTRPLSPEAGVEYPPVYM